MANTIPKGLKSDFFDTSNLQCLDTTYGVFLSRDPKLLISSRIVYTDNSFNTAITYPGYGSIMDLASIRYTDPTSIDGQEAPMVIDADVEGHLIYRMYVDGGIASEFPVKGGIVTLHNNTIIPTECGMVAEAPQEPLPNEPATTEGIKVAIYPKYPEQTITIGGSLSKKGKMELCDLLRNNLDILA
ncbi:hypothetical protein Tco_0144931 [Tanacetum coccineum]